MPRHKAPAVPPASPDLHPDLNFLRDYMTPAPRGRYSDPPFLVDCQFNDPVWFVDAGHRFTVNWEVPVGAGGARLTSTTNAELLRLFRSWLSLQAHPDSGFCLGASRHLYNRVRCVGTLIDYFLVHADNLGIATHGFGAVTSNDIVTVLAKLRDGTANSHLFEWPSRLSGFLRTKVAESEPSSLQHTLDSHEVLRSQEPADHLTSLTRSEVMLARAWLWNSRLYVRATRSNRTYLLKPDSQRLADLIYEGRLTHARSMPLPPELVLSTSPALRREYPAVPVRASPSEGGRGASHNGFVFAIKSLAHLTRDGFEVPDIADALERPVSA